MPPGPGHGKAVITSYVLASGDSVRRGVAISFAAAFVQALSAIVIVGIATLVIGATAQQMTGVTDWVEIASYAAIVLLGLWLLWSKTFGGGHHHHHHHGPATAAAGHGGHHDHAHHSHHHHDHGHAGHAHHDHHGDGELLVRDLDEAAAARRTAPAAVSVPAPAAPASPPATG